MKITTNKEHATRALSVQLPKTSYRTLRQIAIYRDLKNSQVVEWALELLERHVQEGGTK